MKYCIVTPNACAIRTSDVIDGVARPRSTWERNGSRNACDPGRFVERELQTLAQRPDLVAQRYGDQNRLISGHSHGSAGPRSRNWFDVVDP
jgi:hypothetical protein